MITKTFTEKPLIELRSSDFNDDEQIEIYANDLRYAKVGDIFEAPLSGGCGRAVHHESIEIVYKTITGIAALFRCEGTTDSPTPKPWANEPGLIWFEIHGMGGKENGQTKNKD